MAFKGLNFWVAALMVVAFAAITHHFNDPITSIVEAFDEFSFTKQVMKDTKPPHCRPDLPGCVPRVIENIFFVHVPKAAGSSTLYFLWQNSERSKAMAGHNPLRYTFDQCDVRQLGLGKYSCTARRGWSTNVSDFARSCRVQADALQSSIWEDPFSKLGCSTISGHFDLAAFHRMHPQVKEKTLVVVSMREPRDLIVSLFSFMPLQQQVCSQAKDDDPLCSSPVKQWDSSTDLYNFIRDENGLGLDLRGGMTKLLAGDYCCWHDKPPLTDHNRRLQAASFEMDNTVGVILLKERMPESLRYLAFVLGWSTEVDTNVVVNANPHPGNLYSLPRRTRRELTRVTMEDRMIYSLAQQRLNEQLRGLQKLMAKLS